MYNKEYLYHLTDDLHFNVYAVLLKNYIKEEKRVIIKVFKKEDNIVVIETDNYKDTILKDTRKNKNDDILTYDLIYLKTLHRYTSDYELPGMIYESIEGLGSWYRVKIDGIDPSNKLLKPFYLKKKISKEDLKKYANAKEDLALLENLYDKTKGLLKFTKPKKVEELLKKIEENNLN